MALINVPLTGQNLGNTRVPINTNFATINTAFAIDHVAFATSGEGWHNKVTLPVQGGVPTFASGQDGIYNFANATTGSNELYAHIQKAGGSATADIPFTASSISQNSGITNGSTGWTYLPSGILMRWDYFTYSTNTGNITYTYPTGADYPPAFNNLFSVQITPTSVAGGDQNFSVRLISILNSTQFSVYFSNRTSVGPWTGAQAAIWVLSIGN
jgi:hypothetical protein